MSDQKNKVKAGEKRSWTKPTVRHKTSLERVKAGMYVTLALPESPVYAPS